MHLWVLALKREKFQMEQGDKWITARQQWRGVRLFVPKLLKASGRFNVTPLPCLIHAIDSFNQKKRE